MAETQFGMIGNWHSDCCVRLLLLHHDMTTTLPHLQKAMAREDGTNLSSREDEEFTQRLPPFELYTPPRAGASEFPQARLFQKIALMLP